jgi:hypothetical protein
MQVIILNQDNVETTMRFYSILHAKLDKNITGILNQRPARPKSRLKKLESCFRQLKRLFFQKAENFFNDC